MVLRMFYMDHIS